MMTSKPMESPMPELMTPSQAALEWINELNPFHSDPTNISNLAREVAELVTAPVTQSMFDALVCFASDEGLGALKGSTLLRLLNQHFYAAAAQQFERLDKEADPETGEQVVSPRLKRRRLAERHLFEKEGFQP